MSSPLVASWLDCSPLISLGLSPDSPHRGGDNCAYRICSWKYPQSSQELCRSICTEPRGWVGVQPEILSECRQSFLKPGAALSYPWHRGDPRPLVLLEFHLKRMVEKWEPTGECLWSFVKLSLKILEIRQRGKCSDFKWSLIYCRITSGDSALPSSYSAGRPRITWVCNQHFPLGLPLSVSVPYLV